MANHKRTPLVVRLESRIQKSPIGGCWVYMGCRLPRGYGLIGEGGDATKGAKQLLAHRAAWMVYRGEIPAGLDVCHRCDNPPCVNPDHLFLGTRSDNMQDCMRKGRFTPGHVPGEKNGSARLTEVKVKEIRRAYAAGATQTILARDYDTPQANISKIVRRHIWKCIPASPDEAYIPRRRGINLVAQGVS